MKKYLIIFLIVTLLFLALIFIPGIKSNDLNPFQQKITQTKSMEEIALLKISQFRSAQYYYKSLFPYDFLIGEPNWGYILYKSDKFLTPEDIENREFYYSCKNIGVDLNNKDQFFIITTKAVAGLDIESYLKDPIIHSSQNRGYIILNEPISSILSIEILDKLNEGEFPDVNITPGQWQKLITLLKPKIEKEIIAQGILEEGNSSTKVFLTKLFTSMGWNSVEFK